MPPPKKRQKHDGARAASSAASSAAASPVKRRDADDTDDTGDSDAAWSDPDTDGLVHYDSEDLHRRRPNRWRGHRRAWLRRTQSEQLTVAALHGARARDLAAHLYNTYALKQRAAEAEQEGRDAQPDEPPDEPPDEQADEQPDEEPAEDGQHAHREDSPDRLRRDLKREPGDSGSDSDDYGRGYGYSYDYDRSEEGGDPDQKSQASASASAGGGHGSERGRPWAPQALWTAWPLRMHERLFDARPVQEDGHKTGDNDGDDSGDDSDGAEGTLYEEGPAATAAPAAAPSASEVLGDELTATVLRLAKVRFRQRQRQWRRRQRRRRPRPAARPGTQQRRDASTAAAAAAARGQPPVVSADDALSAHLLRPGVRHLLAQTDRLLGALHRVRAATARDDGTLHDWWRLRDWSDVVGAAALAGFDRGVLARTAQRCADLFGQSMVLVDVGAQGSPGGEGAGELALPVAHALYAPRPPAQRFAHLQSDDTCVADSEDALEAAASYSGQLGPRPPLEPLGGVGREDDAGAGLATNGDDAAAEDADDLAAWRQRVQTRYQAWYRDRRQRQQQQILQQQAQQPQPQQESRRKSTPFVPGAPQPVWRCRHKSCDRSVVGFERRSNLTRHLKLVHGE